MFSFKLTYYIYFFFIVILLGSMFVYQETFSVPRDFPIGKNFTVNENESLKSISKRLEDERYINSALLFRILLSFSGRDRHLKIGGYSFPEPVTVTEVVNKFALGKPDVPLVSVTIPEGSTNEEIAAIIHKAIPSIEETKIISFINDNNLHGELFPSTYFLLPSSKPEQIIQLLKTTFEEKYSAFIRGLVMPKPLTSDNEVLSLAAILEGEAKTKEDMEMVAGILLTRLQKGMPLQVDVAPETYKLKGLPLKPINNPGEMAISAVFHASASPYLYYITGNDGKMYYAKTFEEHKRNIQKYLK